MRKSTYGNAAGGRAQGEPVHLHGDRPEGERGPIIGDRAPTISERALKAQKPPKPRRGGRFVMFYIEDMRTPAYQSLNCVAIALLFELDSQFNGSNNGEIELPVKVAARRLHVGKDAITTALRTLVVRGFLSPHVTGKFAPGARRAAKWELTWRPLSEGQAARRLFRKWCPESAPFGT